MYQLAISGVTFHSFAHMTGLVAEGAYSMARAPIAKPASTLSAFSRVTSPRTCAVLSRACDLSPERSGCGTLPTKADAKACPLPAKADPSLQNRSE